MDRDVTADVARAWKLRRDGRTVREIADELGCSVSTAHARVRAAADAEQVVGDPDDRRTARVREAASLDAWADIAESHARAADDPIPAVRALTALSARRSALLGLDAPTRVAVSDDRPDPQPDPDLAAAIEALREGNRAARDAGRRGPGDDGDRGDDPGERAR